LTALIQDKILADCDRDTPMLHRLLTPEVKESRGFLSGPKGMILTELCTECGRCLEVCRFEAISEDFRIDPAVCEGCGLCVQSCSFGAIDFPLVFTGEWFVSETRFGAMVHARLDAGQENSGMLVTLVREKAQELARERDLSLILINGPLGFGVPVISSLAGADGVLVVTEPTQTGLHDLNRFSELSRHFKIPGMVLINKYDLDSGMADRIEDFCRENGLGIAGRLPHDPGISEAMAQGKTIPEWGLRGPEKEIRAIWRRVQENLLNTELIPVMSGSKRKYASAEPAPRFWLGPFNEGDVEQADGLAVVTGPCGDTMEISLKIEMNRVTDSRFRIRGCEVSRACASNAAALAKGRELEEVWDIDENDIARDLPKLPDDHRHCALLARDTLRQAIENYLKSKGKGAGSGGDIILDL